ncbi:MULTISPECIES: hypothetical protein [Chryseobacterium]|uniref:Uncharacterized protein n=2 Tax=Chryseobacterium TaxID=59732 RepID=A0ABM8KBZ5_9FLAO|nr:hypothetical protein [Chryseobacterium sp. APV1]MDO3425067.1 hypothetical protein [Chryseobacterium sp. APV1]BEV05437.1 hypothetical protein CRDW_28110 [Chryseobacterium gambrini]
MTLLIIFFGLAVVYYLFQKNRINRIEKQEYLRERKNEKFEQLLDLARKQDAARSEEQDKNNNKEN